MKPEELLKKLQGVAIAVMTPFTSDDGLNEEGLRKNLRFLYEKCQNEDVFFMLTASTGEFYTLSDSEWERMATVTIEEARGSIPVVVGSALAGTKLTIERSIRAQELGADGVMIVHPYYMMPTREGLYEHYRKIAESIDIGIMIYNNELTTKYWLDPGLAQKITKIPNVVGIKENTTDVHRFHAMFEAIDPKECSIIVGCGEVDFSYFSLFGARGFTSIHANYVPELIIRFYHACLDRDIETIKELLRKVDELNTLIGKISGRFTAPPSVLPSTMVSTGGALFQSFVKVGLDIRGLSGGTARLPMSNLSLEDYSDLQKIINKCLTF